MSVKSTGGMALDLQAARDQLSKDRDAGKVSKRDYKRASKGLNKMIDAERKGVSYQFTGEGRFRTDSSNGQNVSRSDAGIGVNSRLPVMGRQVSKAMGYLQNLDVPEVQSLEDKKPNNNSSNGTGLKTGREAYQSKVPRSLDLENIPEITNPNQEDKPKRSEETFIQDAEKAIAKADREKRNRANELTQKIWDLEREIEKKEAEHKKSPGMFNVGKKNGFEIDLMTGGVSFNREKKNQEEVDKLHKQRAALDGELRRIGNNEEFARPHKTYDKIVNSPMIKDSEGLVYGGPAIPNLLMPYGTVSLAPMVAANSVKALGQGMKSLPAGQKLLNPGQKLLSDATKKASEIIGKTRLSLRSNTGMFKPNPAVNAPKFTPNARVGASKFSPNEKIANPLFKSNPAVTGPKFTNNVQAPKVNFPKFQSRFQKGGKIPKFSNGSSLELAKKRNPYFDLDNKIFDLNKKAKLTSLNDKGIYKSQNLPKWGNRKTLDVPTNRIQNAFNENSRPFDKDSAINTAMGIYGAASLATAKRPRLEKAKRFNLAIRPAQGDEEMVSRSFDKIDQSVRQGAGDLRKRTGSDLTSYVQGVTAMTDASGRSKADVLGANAQMKREDTNRMFGEMNQERQINLNLEEANRREENLTNENIYAGRTQGAQAALNNSLNYGVQKRANDKNNSIQLNMANKRLEMMLQSEASRMRASGSSPEEIQAWMDSMRTAARSYANGGRLSDSARMTISNNKNISDANKALMNIFMEYKKLVSKASVESIKAFNQNIRSINQRNNITITRR